MVNVVLVKFLLGEDAAGGQKLIKVLFLAANPHDIGQLRLDEEIRSIDEALCKSASRQRFQIEQQWAVRVSDLQGLLLRHRPDIVHFSGHGSPASGLFLEDGIMAGREMTDLHAANHAVRQWLSLIHISEPTRPY